MEIIHKLFSNFLLIPPDDKGSTGVMTPEMDKEEIINFLKDDDEDKPLELEPKKEEKAKEEDKEEVKEPDDELKELEQELEEPTDEQLELTTPVRRAEILKKYPTLFKDFPYLEKAYYREQQFTELLPTIDDAKEAVSKAETLDKLEADVMDGNIEKVLQGVKQEEPEAFYKLVDNYLPTLARVDEKAYHHIIGNTIKHVIISMVKESRSSKNEALQSAALILNQYMFGSSEFTQPQNLVVNDKSKEEKSTKDKELQQREHEYNKQKFDDTRDTLNTKINGTLKATIEANIDPKDSMGPYVKKAASNEVMETVISLIERDSRFKTLLDKLWENAVKNNYSRESVDNIRSAYLSRARTLLPSVIKKARNEALKGIGKRVRDDSDEHEEEEKSPSKERRSTPPSNSGRIKEAKDIPKSMRSIDFLMQD
jgi:hypothetical protein